MRPPAPPSPAGPRAVPRRHARYALTLTGIYRVHGAPGAPVSHPRPGETANVSEAGACFLLPERLPAGTSLDLMLRGETAVYMFRAQVVWAGPASASPIPHGVRLEALSPQDQLAWELGLFEQPRRASRIVVELPARCLAEGEATPLSGDVENLGAGGLRIHLPQLLPVGTGVTVTLKSPLQELRLPGRIAWSEALPGDRSAHGVAFTDPAAGKEALHQVVLAEFLLQMGRPEPASS